eukprot:gene16663-10786_t
MSTLPDLGSVAFNPAALEGGTELNQAAQAARNVRGTHVRNLLAPPTVPCREDLDHLASELSDCSARPRLASVYSRPLPAASIHEFLDGRAVEP